MTKPEESGAPDAAHAPGGDPDATTVLPDGSFEPQGSVLEQALAAETAKAAEHYANYVRVLAELDNVRKRAARDADQARRYAVERFAQDLLPALDGFELAQAASEASPEALREGAAATRRLLLKAFESAGITPIEPPSGAPFNPEHHEAMVAQPVPGQPANTIVQTIQKGYQLNGRVLRAARVIVAAGA
jgi:molecular chaperone GrpE